MKLFVPREANAEETRVPLLPTDVGKLDLVQSWVAASSAAWGWQNSKSNSTIPKSFGFEAATHNRAIFRCYPESGLFEPCRKNTLMSRQKNRSLPRFRGNRIGNSKSLLCGVQLNETKVLIGEELHGQKYLPILKVAIAKDILYSHGSDGNKSIESRCR